MEIKNYAPVIIPTLCRYTHFKRCLESLERCSGAKHTDIYIGLDYPPDEKYMKGWKEIDEYLKEKEKCNGFKNLNVRRRKSNCGVGHPGSNGSLLYEEVKSLYDRCIISEDDNEFAPSFLEYVNQGLSKYEKDDSVIDICGYAPVEYTGDKNIYFAHYGNVWGHGVWIKKKEFMREQVNLQTYQQILSDYKKSLKLFFLFPFSLNIMLSNVIRNQYHGDGAILIYCQLFNKYSLFPSKSLVRNWGNDGSGVHTKITDRYDREIDTTEKFELDNIPVKETKVIREALNRQVTKHWYGNLAILLRYLIWRLTKRDLFILLKKVGII